MTLEEGETPNVERVKEAAERITQVRLTGTTILAELSYTSDFYPARVVIRPEAGEAAFEEPITIPWDEEGIPVRVEGVEMCSPEGEVEIKSTLANPVELTGRNGETFTLEVKPFMWWTPPDPPMPKFKTVVTTVWNGGLWGKAVLATETVFVVFMTTIGVRLGSDYDVIFGLVFVYLAYMLTFNNLSLERHRQHLRTLRELRKREHAQKRED